MERSISTRAATGTANMTDPLFLNDTGAEPDWVVPEQGFAITPAPLIVSSAHQEEKMRACGIDPTLFADTVDPSFFIGLGIQAGIRSGISAEGNVNMVQQLIQYRPALLGEELVAEGRVVAVTPVPRGHTVTTEVTFTDQTGHVVIDASRMSLRPDPAKTAARGAGERPQPVVADPASAQTIAAHSLTPGQVKAYSMEGNSIHYEELAAIAAGFRAPLIGGGMGVHYLAAALWAEASVQTLDLSIYFRRPIFWDETFTAAVLGKPQDAESWTALCLLRDEGEKGLKVLTEAQINSITRVA